MRILSIFCALMGAGYAVPACASTWLVTFESDKLKPVQGDQGIKGVKKIEATWTLTELPFPGNCYNYGFDTFTTYTDGRNTLQSLLQKYPQEVPNESPGIRVCLTKQGEISGKSGFSLDLETNSGQNNYKHYSSIFYDYNGRTALVSITSFKHGSQTGVMADGGNKGEFTLTEQISLR